MIRKINPSPGATTLTNAQFRTIADLMLKPGDQGGYAFDGITGEILCFPSDEAAKPVFNLIIHLGKGTDQFRWRRLRIEKNAERFLSTKIHGQCHARDGGRLPFPARPASPPPRLR